MADANNKTDPTTKMNPDDINQDDLNKDNQVRSDETAIDMMKGMHDHEDHSEESDD